MLSSDNSRSVSALDLCSHVEDSEDSAKKVLSTALPALSALTPADRAKFILFGVGPRRRCPFTTVPEAFSHQVRRHASSIAVEHENSNVTYEKLDKLSDIVARRLLLLGVGQGSRVCLLMRRSIAMVVGIIGTLKTGASYVPIDGGIVTDSTLAFILSDSNAGVVLCLREFQTRLRESVTSICLDDIFLWFDINSRSATLQTVPPHPVCTITGGAEIYIIYTSGTTGKPKGVSVSHNSVLNLLSLCPGNLAMKPGMKVSQLMNIAFDMCAWEVLGAIVNGCTLCIRGPEKSGWEDTLSKVDIVIATPSILGLYSPNKFPNIRCVAVAGEPCPQHLADKWAEAVDFYNCCGPTEVTIVNTMHYHRPGDVNTIGRPTPNNSLYVLDEEMKPLPIGEIGMMWASGAGVSNGYVGRLELTRQRWVRDPFRNDGTLIFNTGDLGRWTTSGELQTLGRVDDQVKIKGFRVELCGVAAAHLETNAADSVVALLIDDELWAFVTPIDADIDALKHSACNRLPYYAMPTRYMRLHALPLTSNGKVDKSALRSHIVCSHMESTSSIKSITYPSHTVGRRSLVSPSGSNSALLACLLFVLVIGMLFVPSRFYRDLGTP